MWGGALRHWLMVIEKSRDNNSNGQYSPSSLLDEPLREKKALFCLLFRPVRLWWKVGRVRFTRSCVREKKQEVPAWSSILEKPTASGRGALTPAARSCFWFLDRETANMLGAAGCQGHHQHTSDKWEIESIRYKLRLGSAIKATSG
jgi:hypothetical protein